MSIASFKVQDFEAGKMGYILPASFVSDQNNAMNTWRLRGRYALTFTPRRFARNFLTTKAPDQPIIEDDATAQPTPATI